MISTSTSERFTSRPRESSGNATARRAAVNPLNVCEETLMARLSHQSHTTVNLFFASTFRLAAQRHFLVLK